MRVTSLIENECATGHDDVQAEFGLSLHIQTDDRSILFDTGTTGAFADNAGTLGVDLEAVDLAVLSHQHFDHGGGLKRFFELNETAPVYLRESKIESRWSKAFWLLKRPIGVDRALILRRADRFQFLKTDTEIAPGVWILTWIGTKHPRPAGNRRLFVEREGTLEPDPFDHELVMVIRENDGMVIFSGCSHSGILNMVDSAKTRFPGDSVKAVFGGFHLMGLPWFNTMAVPRPEVEEIARNMLDRVDGPVFTGHCTGKKGFGVLKGVMGDRLQPFSTGATAEI